MTLTNFFDWGKFKVYIGVINASATEVQSIPSNSSDHELVVAVTTTRRAPINFPRITAKVTFGKHLVEFGGVACHCKQSDEWDAALIGVTKDTPADSKHTVVAKAGSGQAQFSLSTLDVQYANRTQKTLACRVDRPIRVT